MRSPQHPPAPLPVSQRFSFTYLCCLCVPSRRMPWHRYGWVLRGTRTQPFDAVDLEEFCTELSRIIAGTNSDVEVKMRAGRLSNAPDATVVVRDGEDLAGSWHGAAEETEAFVREEVTRLVRRAGEEVENEQGCCGCCVVTIRVEQ